MANVKEASTVVKFVKDGVEKSEEVRYSLSVGTDLQDAIDLLKTKLSEDEQTSPEADELAKSKAVDYINQVLETNARQAARSAFLANIEGPDKAIAAMAKKLASVKNITVEEAEKQIRAIM